MKMFDKKVFTRHANLCKWKFKRYILRVLYIPYGSKVNLDYV